MNNFVNLFSEIYSKFIDNFNEDFLKNNNISDNDNRYLKIIYSLKKITLTKFAELAKVTKPAATQIINKFLQKGYVTKEYSKDDRRVCFIELTPKLKLKFNDYYRDLNKLYDESLSFLTKKEKEDLDNILLKINENL